MKLPTGTELVEMIGMAVHRMQGHILRTPVIPFHFSGDTRHTNMYLKLENRQHTGSFKARGALNKILQFAVSHPRAQIVTASTGNHALGVARALKIAGMSGRIYLPENASPSKVRALQQYGAELRFHGRDPLAAELYARQVAARENLEYLSAYNDPEVIAGQGTIGVELTKQLNDIHAVYVTVGGGGMISGIAAWFAIHSPETIVVGCLPERSPEMKLSVEAGHIVHLESYQETLSDGSAGGCEDGSITFPLCQKYVSRFLLVTEEEIAEVMRNVYTRTGERIEGSAGVAVAGMLKDTLHLSGKHVVAIVCGGNIEESKFQDIINK